MAWRRGGVARGSLRGQPFRIPSAISAGVEGGCSGLGGGASGQRDSSRRAAKAQLSCDANRARPIVGKVRNIDSPTISRAPEGWQVSAAGAAAASVDAAAPPVQQELHTPNCRYVAFVAVLPQPQWRRQLRRPGRWFGPKARRPVGSASMNLPACRAVTALRARAVHLPSWSVGGARCRGVQVRGAACRPSGLGCMCQWCWRRHEGEAWSECGTQCVGSACPCAAP